MIIDADGEAIRQHREGGAVWQGDQVVAGQRLAAKVKGAEIAALADAAIGRAVDDVGVRCRDRHQ